MIPKVYLVTNRQAVGERNFLGCVEDALKGGVRIVQYREKDCGVFGYREMALDVQELCRKYNALFYVNDDLDLAVELGADGLHLGQDDLKKVSMGEVRKRFSGALGISAKTVEQALFAQKHGASYIGCGPVFYTSTKTDAGEAIGVGRIREIKSAVRISVVGIGGIDVDNAKHVFEAGADSVALISGILARKDIGETVKLISRDN